MNLSQTVRSMLRRWYILLAGLLVAAGLAVSVWNRVPPTYTRTSTQILLPGEGSIPTGSNPYLFVGGLAPTADILVRGLASNDVIGQATKGHSASSVQVVRDPTTSGPVIVITVESESDASAEQVLAAMDRRTASLLDSLQAEEKIPEKRRISVVPVSFDTEGTVSQKTRMMFTGAAGIAIVVLTVLVAAFVEGVSRNRRAKRDAAQQTSPTPDDGTSSSPAHPGETSPSPATPSSPVSPPPDGDVDLAGRGEHDHRAPVG
ncbi:MAG: hypothetical protein LKI24_06280 [Acidipropionibacterium sp.]|jgi:hypothetical protein|nr:hypothetical protein [Acidipropionibacterium sp.]